MRRLTLLFFGICFTALMSIAQDFPTVSYDDLESSKDYVEGNIYQKDLLLYSHTIGITHPYFADSNNLSKLQATTKQLYNKCANIEDIKSFGSLLHSLISSIDDGHSQVAAGRTHSEIFPLYLMFDTKESGYILAIDRSLKHNLGKRATTINGETVKNFLSKAQGLMSGDNAIFKNNQISKNLSSIDFWREYGYDGDTLTLTFDDGTSTTITTTTADKMVLEQLPMVRNTPTALRNTPFFYQIFDTESICYLQFNICFDNVTHAQINQRFDDVVEAMMAEIDSKSIKTLVVDVRNNSGGNSALCDLLLSYLTDYDSMKQMGCKVRMSELLLKHQPNLRDIALKDGTSPIIGEVFDFWQVKYDNPEAQMSTHRINRDATKLFKGEVIFISGMNTYSSAGLLLTIARDNGIGTIIGEIPCHRPSHYGDVLRFMLPNTQTKATVSCRYITRPNEALNSDTELVPDVVINLSDYNQPYDAAWEYILQQRK